MIFRKVVSNGLVESGPFGFGTMTTCHAALGLQQQCSSAATEEEVCVAGSGKHYMYNKGQCCFRIARCCRCWCCCCWWWWCLILLFVCWWMTMISCPCLAELCGAVVGCVAVCSVHVLVCRREVQYRYWYLSVLYAYPCFTRFLRPRSPFWNVRVRVLW